jgi:DNA-binding NtrC family response regulator
MRNCERVLSGNDGTAIYPLPRREGETIMRNCGKVLIVDDEANALMVLSAILREVGYLVIESQNVDKAIGIIHREDIDAIITDLKMPAKDGYQLFDYVTENHPDIPVMFLTAYGTVESAVTAMSNGAYFYFIKPPDYHKLKSTLAQAIDEYSLKKKLRSNQHIVATDYPPCGILGQSSAMRDIVKTINSVKDSESSVLIQGETGTGKEVIARNLHYRSARHDKPFIAVNCAAIPRELIESELFGYEKGAFTGAVSTRIGKFEEAANGTIFLDEIGELEPSVQSKLLRGLQEREIERLGSNKKTKVNFRLISSTNRDLMKEVAAGSFREDLFYRINVIQIDVPPLRERQEDIPLLVSEFVNEFCLREKRMLTLSEEVMDIFMNYPWPGNIRQLRNVVERAIVLSKGRTIFKNDLPFELLSHGRTTAAVSAIRPLKQLELQAINHALLECSGNKSEAAKKLGISRKTFYKRLKEV